MATPAWERWLLGGKMAALRARIALETESPEAAAESAQKAIAMARTVRRAKYEIVARATLGKALSAMARHQEVSSELHEAVKEADGLGDPASRWRAMGDVAAILGAMGNDAVCCHPAGGQGAEYDSLIGVKTGRRFRVST